MGSRPPGPRGRGHRTAAALLADCSLDVTSKDIGGLEQARTVFPPGTRVHVAFFDGEDLAMRGETVRTVRRFGYVPVPIIAARRLRSAGMLSEFLAVLRAASASENVLIVAGDPAQPLGPFADTASVIGSGLLEEHGVRQVSIAGHPAGHPAVAGDVLWQALADKAAALGGRGLDSNLVTQFEFDAALVLAWLAQVRAQGISLPIRVGVPGPASVRRLLSIASRCGVAVSASVARKYGFSLSDLTGTPGPDRFIGALSSGYDARLHGELKLHFYPFGGIPATAQWIREFRGV